MRAVRADIKGVDGELDGQKFDVIVVRYAFNRKCTDTEMTSTVLISVPPLRVRPGYDTQTRVLPEAGWRPARRRPDQG